MTRYEYHRPRKLEEALRLFRESDGARFVAGCTDVMVKLRGGAYRARTLVSLRSVEDLARVEVAGDRLRVGARATLAEILEHSTVRARFPVLSEAVRTMGSVQIRSVATLCGNLCNASPCADAAPPLLVLDGALRLVGPSGEREVPIGDFFTGPSTTCLSPGEVLADVILDAGRAPGHAVFLKKARVAMDLAQVNLAARLELDGNRCKTARLVAGAVGPTPLRLRAAEAVLEGATLTDAVVAEAAALAKRDVTPITDVRASADYRREIVSVFVRRAVERLRAARAS